MRIAAAISSLRIAQDQSWTKVVVFRKPKCSPEIRVTEHEGNADRACQLRKISQEGNVADKLQHYAQGLCLRFALAYLYFRGSRLLCRVFQLPPLRSLAPEFLVFQVWGL